MAELLATGLAIGLSAGLSPGPLLALVLAEASRGGWRRGALAALAPLVSDGLLIALALMALQRVPAPVLAGLEAVGGLVLLRLGYGVLRAKATAGKAQAAGGLAPAADAAGPGGHGAGAGSAPAPAAQLAPLWQGVLVNLLNPNPWVFWLTAGGTLVRQALAAGAAHLIGFLAAFFGALVGAQVAVALVAGQTMFGSPAYRALLQLSGGALLVLGARALWHAAAQLWP